MQRLVVGVARHQVGELGDELAVPPQREADVHRHRDGLAVQPLQVRSLLAHDRGRLRQVRERGSPPEPHRPRQGPLGRRRVAVDERPGLRDRVLEPLGVQLARLHAERVAGPRAHEALRVRLVPEERSQAGHVHLQQVVGAGRRTVSPQLVDEPVIGNGRPGRGEEHGHEGALCRSSQVEVAVPGAHPQRAEDAEVHGGPRQLYARP
jgi:hypothetical protein